MAAAAAAVERESNTADTPYSLEQGVPWVKRHIKCAWKGARLWEMVGEPLWRCRRKGGTCRQQSSSSSGLEALVSTGAFILFHLFFRSNVVPGFWVASAIDRVQCLDSESGRVLKCLGQFGRATRLMCLSDVPQRDSLLRTEGATRNWQAPSLLWTDLHSQHHLKVASGKWGSDGDHRFN